MVENYSQIEAVLNQAKSSLNNQQNYSNEEVDYSEFMDYEDNQTENEYYSSDNIDYNDVGYTDLPNIQQNTDEVNDIQLNKYDTPLFEGGPTVSQINIWKKQYAGYDIYVTEILDETFVFRTLNRFEYKQLILLENVDSMKREEIICNTVTLFPENYSWGEMAKIKAGIPSTYSEIIMEKSGFTKDYAIRMV